MAIVTQSNRTIGVGPAAYHTGFIVADLEAAMVELSTTLGVTWREPGKAEFTADTPEGPLDMVCRFVYSVEGPPYIELGEFDRTVASPASMPVGATHIGFWSDDIVGDDATFQQAGMKLLFRIRGGPDGTPTLAYHLTQCGLVIETVRRDMMSAIVGETS